MRIDERITDRYADLSPQEQRAAQTLLDHLDELATYRSAELAELSGVSKATMSRLFRHLGFADFDEVRDHLRELRSAGEPRRVDGKPSAAAHLMRETESIRGVLESPAIEAVVALHLRQQVAAARGDVRLAPLPGQMIGEELVDLTPEDVVVAVGFRRRPAGFGGFLAEAAATGASVVLLADGSARQHATLAAHWIECPVSSTLAFDSYAAAMSVVSMLADGVLSATGRAGRDRASEITASYTRLSEVER